MERFAPGQRVRHPRMGDGTVRRLQGGGRTLAVEYDRYPGTPFLSASAECTALGAAPDATPEPAAFAPISRPSPQGAPIRQALEALRLGVVPPVGLAEMTVGREEEIRRVEALLGRGRGMLLVSGEFGSGKTHLIELAEAAALAKGVMVARATFDPVETPPSHPLRVYAALMDGLRLPDSAGEGLGPLLDRLQGSERHISGDRAHRWLSPALWAAGRDAELAADLLDWVDGSVQSGQEELERRLHRAGWRGPGLLALPDFRTFGQIMASLLGAVSVWGRDAGYAGLLVLLDEAEYFDQMHGIAREMAENVLRYLAIAAEDDARLAFAPAAVYRGGQAVHKGISARFTDDQPLMVAASFTPNPELDAVIGRLLRGPGAVVPLDPLPARVLAALAERVLALVQRVYPGFAPEPEARRAIRVALGEAMEEGTVQSTRQAARLVVEYWDLYRRSPRAAVNALRR